jgi:hypothetical protein
MKGGNENMGTMLMLIYWVAGYWAVGQTIYANKVVIYTGNALFLRKAVLGLVFGWILIPLAVIRHFISG